MRKEPAQLISIIRPIGPIRHWSELVVLMVLVAAIIMVFIMPL